MICARLDRLFALQRLEQRVGGRAARTALGREQLDQHGHARGGRGTPVRGQDNQERCAEERLHMNEFRGATYHEPLHVARSAERVASPALAPRRVFSYCEPSFLAQSMNTPATALPSVDAGHVVHLVVDARPDARVAGLLADRPDESARVGNRYASTSARAVGERRVVRRIAREVRHREQRHDRRIELVRPDVPVGELAVLAGDERVELHRRDQRIGARGARRIPVQSILEHPLVGDSGSGQ